MTIVDATNSYERWLARHVDIVRDDLQRKHVLMAQSPVLFLRATYYRWAQRWAEVCPEAADAPAVLGAGDLHVENFGTWRDRDGRLAWGVNDLDEASTVAYTNDLVRLATSATLASAGPRVGLSARQICAALLDGYSASLDRGGRPIVLAERHKWLREIAVTQLKDPARFWEALAANPPVRDLPPAVRRLFALPRNVTGVQIVRRRSGAGSLGRPRFAALAVFEGGFIGREVKAVVPPATAWASGRDERSRSLDLHQRAVRAIDPFFTATAKWIARRLSPDCSKIELHELPDRDDGKLVRAMGWETANLHLATATAVPAIRRDLSRRPSRWLEQATTAMTAAVSDDYREWRRR